MSRFHSLLALSCALVVTTAQTPTRMSWGESPALAVTPDVMSGTGSSRAPSIAGNLGGHALDDSDQVRVNASQLRRLNVDLPALFDWSDDHQTYYVDAKTFAQSQPDALINTHSSQPHRIAMLPDHGHGHGFGGVGGLGGSPHANAKAKASQGSPSPAGDNPVVSGETAALATIAGLTDDTSERVFEDIITEEIITGSTGDEGSGLLTSIDSTSTGGAKQQNEGERPSEQPIPVPLPGTLFLFALGLGGLQVIGRRKK